MIDFFLNTYKNATEIQIITEFLAFIFGILSVWFAKKENIWVYPTGLLATVLTSYLLYTAGYLGDMLVNAYFSVMSVYGWYNWSKKDNNDTNPATKKLIENNVLSSNHSFKTCDLFISWKVMAHRRL